MGASPLVRAFRFGRVPRGAVVDMPKLRLPLRGTGDRLGLAVFLRVTPLPLPVLTGWAGVVAASRPAIYRRAGRRWRDVLRAMTGVGAAALLSGTWAWTGVERWVAGGMFAASIAAYFAVYAPRRARQRRIACEGCEEIAAGSVCSGFLRQAEASRRF